MEVDLDSGRHCTLQSQRCLRNARVRRWQRYYNNKRSLVVPIELRLTFAIIAGYGPDFYWLGRVPCRSVVLYGIVVGAQQYENRTLYSGRPRSFNASVMYLYEQIDLSRRW